MLRGRYFTFTVAEKRLAGREKGSDTIFGTAFTYNSFSLSERRTTHPHTHGNAHLRAAAAGCPHFSVDVLFQLKLWLIGFLHGPVLQFSDGNRKECDHSQPKGGAITAMILIDCLRAQLNKPHEKITPEITATVL